MASTSNSPHTCEEDDDTQTDESFFVLDTECIPNNLSPENHKTLQQKITAMERFGMFKIDQHRRVIDASEQASTAPLVERRELGGGRFGVFATTDIAGDVPVCVFAGRLEMTALARLGPLDLDIAMDRVVHGFEEPETCIGIGQFVRDAGMPTDSAAGLRSRFGYDVKRAKQCANVTNKIEIEGQSIFWLQSPVMVTTRPIAAGEELFVCRGATFWWQRPQLSDDSVTAGTDTKPFVRLSEHGQVVNERSDAFPLDRPWVEVRQSSIPGAGRGVFAARRIRKGTVVAVYGGEVASSERFFVHAADQETGEPAREAVNHDYDLVLRSGCFLRGFQDPRSKHACAQIINDGARLRENSIRAIDEYVDRSWSRTNVEHPRALDGSVCPLAVATRDIYKGEELFWGYGHEYWLRRLDKGMRGERAKM